MHDYSETQSILDNIWEGEKKALDGWYGGNETYTASKNSLGGTPSVWCKTNQIRSCVGGAGDDQPSYL